MKRIFNQIIKISEGKDVPCSNCIVQYNDKWNDLEVVPCKIHNGLKVSCLYGNIYKGVDYP